MAEIPGIHFETESPIDSEPEARPDPAYDRVWAHADHCGACSHGVACDTLDRLLHTLIGRV